MGDMSMECWFFIMGLLTGILIGTGIMAVYNLAHEDDDFEYPETAEKEEEEN